MPSVACYIDGFNLYHALDALGNPKFKWVNLRDLMATYCRPGENITSINYFSAFAHWNIGKVDRHKEYVAALQAVGVTTIMSSFKKTPKKCSKFQRTCSFYEEKQTDVGLAARILADGLKNPTDRMLIVSADSDLVPAIATLRAVVGPAIELTVLAPPGRERQANELAQAAHALREIKAGTLPRCLFPRNVVNANGKVMARAPAAYGIL